MFDFSESLPWPVSPLLDKKQLHCSVFSCVHLESAEKCCFRFREQHTGINRSKILATSDSFFLNDTLCGLWFYGHD